MVKIFWQMQRSLRLLYRFLISWLRDTKMSKSGIDKILKPSFSTAFIELASIYQAKPQFPSRRHFRIVVFPRVSQTLAEKPTEHQTARATKKLLRRLYKFGQRCLREPCAVIAPAETRAIRTIKMKIPPALVLDITGAGDGVGSIGITETVGLESNGVGVGVLVEFNTKVVAVGVKAGLMISLPPG